MKECRCDWRVEPVSTTSVLWHIEHLHQYKVNGDILKVLDTAMHEDFHSEDPGHDNTQ